MLGAFKKGNIRRRLMSINLFSTGVTLISIYIILLVFGYFHFRSDLINDLEVQSNILIKNTIAALIFDDQRRAEETLASLRGMPDIAQAVIYTRNAVVFAQYARNRGERGFHMHGPRGDSFVIEKDHVDLFRSIISGGEKLGTLYMRSDSRKLYASLISYLIFITAVTSALFVIALLLLSRLQESITSPIFGLLNIMQTVSSNKNYFIRSALSSEDEFGMLAKGFNEMLDQVQKRDSELEVHRSKLEELVRIRTTELEKELSERKRAETELKKYRDHLEDLMTQRTTELSIVHEQLRQSQKMEAVGLLARGIAHDFSNVLSAIKGCGFILKKQHKEDSRLRGYAEQILSSCDRANNLTQGLLSFSRSQTIMPRHEDVNEIIKKTGEFLSGLLGNHIEFHMELVDGGLPIMADKGQIEQVLMNLTINAKDAMPDGGELTIKTDKVYIDKEFVSKHGYGKPGEYAHITISDTGMGMDEDTKRRIFEPFFTTKEIGKGTGLGLAIVYGIIKQHNGYIDVYSENRKSTAFEIYLPFAGSKDGESQATVLPLAKGGTETILLADDDDAMRKIIREALKEAGYKVVEAVDGEEALRVFNENIARIGLAVLDVIMPKKNGMEVYEEIKRIDPDGKVLFMSGHIPGIIDSDESREGKLNFISKSASTDELLRKIRGLLDAGSSLP